MSREIVYIDMDDTLVDFQSGIDAIVATRAEERDRTSDWDDVEGIFLLMQPMPGAIEAAKELAELFDVYVLTKSPWRNQSAPSDKLSWIKCYFGDSDDSIFYKKVILSGHKQLNRGHFLIDDKCSPGFDGVHIKIKGERFPDWPAVLEALRAHHAGTATIAPCDECQPQ